MSEVSGHGLKENTEWASGLWLGRDGAEEEARAALGVDAIARGRGNACADERVVGGGRIHARNGSGARRGG